jgi:hypothetical protein
MRRMSRRELAQLAAAVATTRALPLGAQAPAQSTYWSHGRP